MPAKDTSQLKEKIIQIFRKRGASLPVHIAKETGLSMLFSSAFLSELISERKLKMSNLRVGSSPVYFIPGQEPTLEKFANSLKSKEKEAFILLKDKKFLKDSEQLPAIRVALRAIKDFAIPLEKENGIYWRYFTFSESEIPATKSTQIPQSIIEDAKTQINKEIKEAPEGVPQKEGKENKIAPDLNIFDQSTKQDLSQKITEKKVRKKKIIKKRTTTKKQNEKFFNKVKTFLSKKNIKISDIEGFSKDDLTLKVQIKGRETLLVAYNKRRIKEEDITKAYKKAAELNLPYTIMSLGEPLKKLTNFIKAIKNLNKIEKIEE